MNAKNSKSPHATTRPADEPDDPGPSTSGYEPEDVAGAAIQMRIGGEAVREIDAQWLRDHLIHAAALVPARIRCVNIEVVHDRRMAALHEQHLGIAETTDVLTFPASESNEPIEADIVVCLDEARWRADQYEHAVERELLLYALHGLLHCAGFDDHDEASFAAMHAEEDRILEAVGVGRTFWAEVAGAAGMAGHDASRSTPAHENSGRELMSGRRSRDQGTDD